MASRNAAAEALPDARQERRRSCVVRRKVYTVPRIECNPPASTAAFILALAGFHDSRTRSLRSKIRTLRDSTASTSSGHAPDLSIQSDCFNIQWDISQDRKGRQYLRPLISNHLHAVYRPTLRFFFVMPTGHATWSELRGLIPQARVSWRQLTASPGT
jgi:hypothetical protein